MRRPARLRRMLATALLVVAWPVAMRGGGAAQAADELAATRPDAAVLVTGGGVTGVFYRLEPGSELSFDTAGPSTLEVEVRRRLPSVGARPDAVRIDVLGDGQRFMEIVAGQVAVEGPSINDGRGGALSGPDRATVTVPDGGARLTLRAPPGSPDILVRVRPQ